MKITESELQGAYNRGRLEYLQRVHMCPYHDVTLAAAWNRGYLDARNSDIQSQLEVENDRKSSATVS